MSGVAIRIEGLGKQYRIEGRQQPTLLREVVTDWGQRAARSVTDRLSRSRQRSAQEMFWALRNVSFDVSRGETLGIIGRNGSGKSTLLKILSRITEPTEGNAWIEGRVGSLLEVGTGFHPELSGRENTYLNGAILGMTRTEIDRKFDEIVEFSGVGRFLDTPVKRYSSGMYLRLAFAVAAHLEPEILIVDEVLAVGDASFQRKCIAKMAEVAREGRTVLFVSHNMAAVRTLCRRAVLLQEGEVVAHGPADGVVAGYLESLDAVVTQNLRDRLDRRGRGDLRFAGVEIAAGESGADGVLVTGWPAQFTFHMDRSRAGLSVAFTIFDAQGQPVCSFDSRSQEPERAQGGTSGSRLLCEVPDLPLVPGFYRINAAAYTNGELQDYVEGVAVFEVAEGVLHGQPVALGSGHGSVRLPHRWVLTSAAAHG